MSIPGELLPPIDVLNVEFGDRGVIVTFIDPQRASQFVNEIRQLQISPAQEQLGRMIREVLEDLWALVDAAEQEQTSPPMVVRRRARPGEGTDAGAE